MSRQTVAEIQDEAARWVARMDGAGWSDGGEAGLEAWLAADPRHHGALLQAQAAWLALDAPAEAPSEPVSGRTATRRWVLAGAGGTLAASVAGGWLLLAGRQGYATGIGEIRRVPLDDGSIATINTDSRIAVQLGDTRRDIRLDQGEAWFQVAKDARRPFLVEAGRIRAQAVGTAFSVRRRANGADILVTEGVVEAWASGAEGHRVRLTAGSSAFVADDAAILVKPAEPSAVDRTLAWRSGKIDLAGASLAEAAAEFNRYNRRAIAIDDPALGREAFDGTFRIDDPAGFAAAAASGLDADVDLSDPAIIRIARRRAEK